MIQRFFRLAVRLRDRTSVVGVRRRSLLVLALVAACTNPTGPNVNYAGEWAGSTVQGEPISFAISTNQAVTTITVGYSFGGCRDSKTFPNLSLSIVPQVMCIPGPCTGSVSAYRGFGFEAGTIQEPRTQVNALLFAGASAQGTVNFRDYGSCGTAIGVAWTATKR